MAADRAVVVEGLADLDLEAARPVIYDRPIALRQLFLRAQGHRHTAAHTVVVLEGRLEVNGTVVGPGSYCHRPAGDVEPLPGPSGRQA